MGQDIFSIFEKTDSVKNDGDKQATSKGAEMSNKQFNDDFRKAATAGTLTEVVFPGSDALLQQLELGGGDKLGKGVLGALNGIDNPLNKLKPADKKDNGTDNKPGDKTDSKPADQDKGITGIVQDVIKNADSTAKQGKRLVETISEVAAEVITKHIKEGEERQHKIAEKAAKEKDVQKVTEKHDGPISTVIVEKNDGSVITHQPDGTKVTEKDGLKTTDYPNEVNPTVSQRRQYPNGAEEIQNRDGSHDFIDPSGDRTRYFPDHSRTDFNKDGSTDHRKKDGTHVHTSPDGIKTTRQKDGTEIVEKPNGDRTVTKPEKVETDGTKVWHKTDGTEVREAKDGSRTTIYPESVNEKLERVVQHPNGDTEHVSRDGSKVKVEHTGKVSVSTKEGNTTTFHPNGDVESYNAKSGTTVKIEHDGSIVTAKKDGTTKTIHPNGTIESVSSNGDRTIKSPDGEVTKIKHDGTVTRRNQNKINEAGKQTSDLLKGAKSIMDLTKIIL